MDDAWWRAALALVRKTILTTWRRLPAELLEEAVSDAGLALVEDWRRRETIGLLPRTPGEVVNLTRWRVIDALRARDIIGRSARERGEESPVHVGLDSVVAGTDSARLGDILPDVRARAEFDRVEARVALPHAVRRLDRREILVLAAITEGFTLREVAEELGVTESRVSQVVQDIVRRRRRRREMKPVNSLDSATLLDAGLPAGTAKRLEDMGIRTVGELKRRDHVEIRKSLPPMSIRVLVMGGFIPDAPISEGGMKAKQAREAGPIKRGEEPEPVPSPSKITPRKQTTASLATPPVVVPATMPSAEAPRSATTPAPAVTTSSTLASRVASVLAALEAADVKEGMFSLVHGDRSVFVRVGDGQ